jgi:DNA-binding NarL/FixJ family response regulator
VRLRVLVIDDEELVQLGFRLLLGEQDWVERCLAAMDRSKALELADRWQPNLVLIDAGLVGARASNLVSTLRARRSNTRVLLLTTVDAMTPPTALALGADGHICKRWPARAMLDVMRPSRHQAAGVRTRARSDSSLSTRQREILYLIAAGATNAEIARRLYLSPDTVKQHATALYRKLGVHTRMHAVRVARESGLLAV